MVIISLLEDLIYPQVKSSAAEYTSAAFSNKKKK